MRVVSLLASGTEIVCALGAGEWLVGRSHECDNPSWVRTLPACSEPAFDVTGSSREIDAEVKRRFRAGEPMYVIHEELIQRLAPDVVIAQEHCAVCAVTPGSVAGVCGAKVVALNAGSLAEIERGVMQVAEALGIAERGAETAARERARLQAVRSRVSGLPRVRVAMIEWTDPVFEMSNWIPELVEIANGELVKVADSPDVLIVAPCGYSLERAQAERPVLERYGWWRGLRRVAFGDGNLYFNRSGMTVARTAEIIAEILHGVTSGDAMQGVGWRWLD